ncbi:MAG: hypothetical protein R3C11_25450 [Planctomycetaceae bacterium]
MSCSVAAPAFDEESQSGWGDLNDQVQFSQIPADQIPVAPCTSKYESGSSASSSTGDSCTCRINAKNASVRCIHDITWGSPGTPVYQEIRNTRPFMEYSRLFDATDADLTNFRDYCELSGDPRSGSWASRLHRSDDFIRFVSHLMVKEMLMLHGGEARRRIIFVPRKFK